MPFNSQKYQPYLPLRLSDRTWPDQSITQAPRWCSVDLRDGNQALVEPMSVADKFRLFDLLVAIGFNEIEVGFPAASEPDFRFIRELIEQRRIPSHVSIQVLTPAREALIQRTFEALAGCHQAVVHLYNSTSPVQREKVFGLSTQGIVDIAVQGARWVQQEAQKYPETQWTFQYSPESFSATEPEFAVEVVNAVLETWDKGSAQELIVNLPATVEVSTPNVFADQIEFFCREIKKHSADRKHQPIISLHTHNDRGCAVAAAELGVMAGADRIEGTLLGNGERTGNMDIVTMAMNLYSQGVDPELDLAAMDEIICLVQDVTNIPVHPRHPYAGELVYTAFSGSHQDAIRKCMHNRDDNQPWNVAYLPIDPKDIGRDYEAIVRINSQSGKGGISFVMEQEHGIRLPRWMQLALSQTVQQDSEQSGQEISAARIWSLFETTFMPTQPLRVTEYELSHQGGQRIRFNLLKDDKEYRVAALGSGAMEAFCNGINQLLGIQLDILDYEEHSLQQSAHSKALAMIQLSVGGSRLCGAAIHQDAVLASLNAITAALNQQQVQQTLKEIG